LSGGLTKKVGVIGAARMVALSVNILVASIFLSRYLDQGAYGTFQQTWFFTHMLLEIALLGFPVGILYFFPKFSPDERKAFFIRFLGGLVLLGGALALLLYGCAPLLASAFHNPALKETFRIFALYALFSLPGLPMDALLIAQDRHKLLGVITVAHATLLLAAVLLPALLGFALSGILWAVVGFGLVRTGLLTWGARSAVGPGWGAYPEGMGRRFFLYSLPVGLNSILRVVAKWLDKNIVSAYFQPETFAVYANGAVEIPFVGVLAGAISSVVIPEFSRLHDEGNREDLIALWHRAIQKAGAILLPLFVFLMVMAPTFLVFLFSERYRASAEPFRIYLLLLPLRCATYTPVLLALGRSKAVALGALADVLTNLGLSIALIPRFSYLGPAMATVATTYGQALFYLLWTARVLSLSWRRIFPWKGVGRLFLFSASALPILLFVHLVLPLSPFFSLAAGSVLYFFPVTFLLWRYGPLTETDRDFVRRILARVHLLRS